MWSTLRAVWPGIENCLDALSLVQLGTAARAAISVETCARLADGLVQLGQPGQGRVNGQLQRLFQALVEPCMRLRTHSSRTRWYRLRQLEGVMMLVHVIGIHRTSCSRRKWKRLACTELPTFMPRTLEPVLHLLRDFGTCFYGASLNEVEPLETVVRCKRKWLRFRLGVFEMQMEHLAWHPIESNDDLDSETTSQARMYTLSAYPFIRLTQNQRLYFGP